MFNIRRVYSPLFDLKTGETIEAPEPTSEEMELEKQERAATTACAVRRREQMLSLGWTIKNQRQYYQGHCTYGAWATDPMTGEEISFQEAEKLQLDRDPKSLENWPKFPPRPLRHVDDGNGKTVCGLEIIKPENTIPKRQAAHASCKICRMEDK